MKQRLLAFLLAVCLIGTGSLTVCAKADKTVYPLVVVSGFGAVPLYLDPNTPQAQQVFAPTTSSILKGVSQIVLPTWKLRMNGDWDAWTQSTMPTLASVLELTRCDADGNSVYNVNTQKFPLNAGNYPEFYTSDHRDEAAFVRAGIDAFGAENTYFFSYDWRLDPMDHADNLDAFIRSVLRETGQKKVNLGACSMGGNVTMAYLYKYGASRLHTCVLDNTAFQGITMVGEVFSLKLSVDKETMVEYLFQFVNWPDSVRDRVKKAVKQTRFADRTMDMLQTLSVHLLDDAAVNTVVSTFGQMPGMWSFVADAEYETAKKAILDPVVHAELIRKIDRYHYRVQCRAKTILQKALNFGCTVTIVANYGQRAIPITPSKMRCDDYLIDTALASGGAICADNGQTLPDGYVQQRDRRHNHISPDRRIDASTCMFPEYTWFIRDMGHLDFPYGTQGADFLIWLVSADRQLTIRSDERYPQFMTYDKRTGTLSAQ